MMRKLYLIALAAVFVGFQAEAITPGPGGFEKIPKRNVFGLKDPPPISTTNAPAPEIPLPKITLTGVTTIIGRKVALFKVEFPAVKGEKARQDSFMLSEGQREDGIEVLTIDENAGRVRFNNTGTIMPVEFDKDSLKTPGTNSAAQPAAAPGVAPAANPQIPQARPSPFQGRPFGRSLKLPGSAASTILGKTQTTAAATTGQASGAVPAASGGASVPQLSPEQEALLQELQRQANPPSVPAQLQRPPTMPQLPQ